MNIPFLRALLLGLKSLALHPLRSLLTVLGIFIGTASVIWLLAIGQGISLKAQEQISSLGATNIIIRSLKPPNEAIEGNAFFVSYGVTRDDYDRLTSTIPTIDAALRIREIRRKFRFANREVDGRLVGCTPEYADVMHLQVHRGHFISDSELTYESNVCVLAAGTAEKLFPFEDPIGRVIHVEEDYYRVVGVMQERIASAGIGGSLAAQDFRYDVYIPITTLWDRISDYVLSSRSGTREGEIVELSQITLRVAVEDQEETTETVIATAEEVKDLMKRHHRVDDYAVVVPAELLKQAENTRQMFIFFMGMIAAISLVVGGIGIMNIMLATVTERTREIGIRRALGARRWDITRQFLVETTILSVLGGLVGVTAGLACEWSWIINQLRRLFAWALDDRWLALPETIREVQPALVPESIPLAFGISVMIGIVFGIYPAIRAAYMDPIEALRHE